jgi:hypothetical protein
MHCPVCENGLYSGILILLREINPSDATTVKLLQEIDRLVERDAEIRLSAAAILLNDGGYRALIRAKIDDQTKVADLPLTQAIAFKDARSAELVALAKEANLNHIQFAIDSVDGPAGYHINKEADITVLGYTKDKVLVNRAFKKGDLTGAAATDTVNELEKAFAKITGSGSRRQ